MARQRTRRMFGLLVVLPLITSAAGGAFLRNVPVTVTQPDGAVLHCYATGDEFHNWLHDGDGFTILQDAQLGTRERDLLVRAVAAVSAEVPANLVIDADNDGYVDNVCFIVKGAHRPLRRQTPGQRDVCLQAECRRRGPVAQDAACPMTPVRLFMSLTAAAVRTVKERGLCDCSCR